MSFICNFENRYTDNYKFSVYTKDDPDLLHLKMLVAAHNKRVRDYVKRFNKMPSHIGKLKRVALMARGPRQVNGVSLHPNAVTSLRHEYAVYFDVYTASSSENYWLQRQIDTGLTRSELKKYDTLTYEATKLEWQGKRRLAA
jgi:hypothetical protein